MNTYINIPNKSRVGTKKTNLNNDTEAAYQIIMDAIVTQKLAPRQKDLIGWLIAQKILASRSPSVTQVAPMILLKIKQNFTLRKIFLLETISLVGAKFDFKKLDHLSERM